MFTSGPVPVGAAAAAARRALPLAGEHAQVGLSVAGIARPTIGVGVCACVCMGSGFFFFFFKGRALSVGIYETIVFYRNLYVFSFLFVLFFSCMYFYIED